MTQLNTIWRDYGMLVVVLGLVAYTVGVAKLAYYFAEPESYVVYFLMVVIATLVGARVTYADVPSVITNSVRVVASVLAVYLVLAYPSFDAVSHADRAHLIAQYQFIRWSGVVAGCLTLLRPSFALIVAAAVVVTKGLSWVIIGLPLLSVTDYLPVVEFLVILVLGILFARLVLFLQPRVRQLASLNAQCVSVSGLNMLFIFAVSVHFANYLFSGLAKLQLDGPLFAWVENLTPAFMEVAGIGGHVPLGAWPELAQSAHAWFLDNYIWLNWVTLLSQLLAIMAIGRVVWAMWLTAFYDVSHIVIALVTGIFFWKWIILNAVIVAGLVQLRNLTLKGPLVAIMIASMLGGQYVFFAAKLGWYDTQAFVHHYFNVVDTQGRIARVPTNYFLAGSVTVAQHRMGTPLTGHFAMRTWGSTRVYGEEQAARKACELERGGTVAYGLDELRLQKFVRSHHNYVLRNVDGEGHLQFDVYPHHIFSMPSAHEEFYRVDLRNITHYEYVVESICTNHRFGDTADERLQRDSIRIDALN